MDTAERKHLKLTACNVRKGIIEGTFKAVARALAKAVAVQEAYKNEIPSTKGVL